MHSLAKGTNALCSFLELVWLSLDINYKKPIFFLIIAKAQEIIPKKIQYRNHGRDFDFIDFIFLTSFYYSIPGQIKCVVGP